MDMQPNMGQAESSTDLARAWEGVAELGRRAQRHQLAPRSIWLYLFFIGDPLFLIALADSI